MTLKKFTSVAAFLILFLFVLQGQVNGQTIRAKVSLRAERLLPIEQDLLTELPRQLEDYINTFTWSEENEDIIIECTIELIIETLTSRGSDKIYRAQFLISSPSGENFYDRTFEFTYQRGQSLDHQRTLFDPLLDLIDFYVYMVIAGELDTYILFGGSHYYDLALNLANQGLVSIYQAGWRNRIEEVKLITDGDHVPLREAKFYYYEGLYYIEEEKNREKAQEMARKVVDLLDKVHKRRPNSKALKRFFDSHYQEFCSLFVYDESDSNLKRLMVIDNRHREIYEECL